MEGLREKLAEGEQAGQLQKENLEHLGKQVEWYKIQFKELQEKDLETRDRYKREYEERSGRKEGELEALRKGALELVEGLRAQQEERVGSLMRKY